MDTVQETREKLLAIDCLRAMKQQKTFRQLSKELSLPAGVLNRYINGYVLPKEGRAKELIQTFLKTHLQKVAESARTPDSKFIVTADILSQPFLLSAIAFKVAQSFPEKVDRIFTAAVDGIPLAQAIAYHLGARCIYAKHTQELSFSDHYVSKAASNRPLSAPFFLPKSLLKKNDRVLIVDDVIRAGTTFDALTSICAQARADVSGIFALFITGAAYRQLKKHHKVAYLMLAD